MAEVQTSTESGEMAQHFIEMVMMQAQNAAFALGQIPHPQTGETPVNLELARLFIDQLIVLRVKTRGNLNPDEAGILNNAISNLQMAYVEASQGASASAGNDEPPAAPAEIEEPPAAAAPPASDSAPGSEESRKKFTKSYGA